MLFFDLLSLILDQAFWYLGESSPREEFEYILIVLIQFCSDISVCGTTRVKFRGGKRVFYLRTFILMVGPQRALDTSAPEHAEGIC